MEDEVDEEDGVTPSEEEKDEEVKLLEDEVLEIKLDELELVLRDHALTLVASSWLKVDNVVCALFVALFR